MSNERDYRHPNGYNNGKIYNHLSKMNEIEKKKAIHDFAEGSLPLEEALIALNENGLETLGCCVGHKLTGSPYIAFRVTPHNYKNTLNLLDKVSKIRGSIIGFRVDAEDTNKPRLTILISILGTFPKSRVDNFFNMIKDEAKKQTELENTSKIVQQLYKTMMAIKNYPISYNEAQAMRTYYIMLIQKNFLNSFQLDFKSFNGYPHLDFIRDGKSYQVYTRKYSNNSIKLVKDLINYDKYIIGNLAQLRTLQEKRRTLQEKLMKDLAPTEGETNTAQQTQHPNTRGELTNVQNHTYNETQNR